MRLRRAFVLPALIIAGLAAPALATGGGAIGTLQIGYYVCELPGQATGPVALRQQQEDFRITNASSYAVGKARGAYLLVDDLMVITSGPKRGQKFRRVSNSFLRKLAADGSDSDLRCVRQTANNR